MIYEYKCEKCKINFDIVKHHSKHRDPENCGKCGLQGLRLFGNAELSIDKMQPEYYHAFGEVVKSRRHRTELMKKNDMVEMGSEKPKKMHSRFQNQRDQKRNQRWNED